MAVTIDGTNGITTPVISASNIVGSVAFFAFATAPTGWLKCGGQAVSRSTYSALFAAMGTLYGVGDGFNTFNLPDLRGEFIRGFDDGRAIDSGRAIGTSQTDAFKAHFHVEGMGVNTNETGRYGNTATGISEIVHTAGSTDTDGANTSTVGDTETRPRNVALLACIKF